jgi:hypothetical protein
MSTTASLGVRPDHLFGVHRHEVAQKHADGLRKTFVEGSGGELDGQASGKHHPALTASNNAGMLPWHGLKPLPVLMIPLTGRSSASSV